MMASQINPILPKLLLVSVLYGNGGGPCDHGRQSLREDVVRTSQKNESRGCRATGYQPPDSQGTLPQIVDGTLCTQRPSSSLTPSSEALSYTVLCPPLSAQTHGTGLPMSIQRAKGAAGSVSEQRLSLRGWLGRLTQTLLHPGSSVHL